MHFQEDREPLATILEAARSAALQFRTTGLQPRQLLAQDSCADFTRSMLGFAFINPLVSAFRV